MATFRYQAADAAGELVRGELEADSVQQAMAQLEGRGLTVQSIGYASSSTQVSAEESLAAAARAADHPAVEPQRFAGESVEQAVLRSHMTTILERGRAILPALRAYADELPPGRPRRELLAVCRVLAGGDADIATTALAALPEYWIPLLSAAISSTDPGHVLTDFLRESRQTDDLRHQWSLTLAYPILLLGMATAVLLALSIFVIPEFGNIFADFGLELPPLTKFILFIADWLVSWGGLVIAVLAIAFVAVALNSSRLLPVRAFAWPGERIRLPLGRRAAIARFARFLADLLEAGVKLPDALRIAGYCVSRQRLRRAAWNLASHVESDGAGPRSVNPRPLSAAIAHAVTAEMSTAARAHMLREISDCHAERVRIGLSWTSGLVEPVAILMVGLAVGMVVLGLFLPLVKLVEGLSG